ncbi:MAG: polyphosphate polymerase domain-containing protein [Spirosomataceae bacterium]
MKIDEVWALIHSKTSAFEPISLAEMDGVKLMNRTDAKYLIPTSHLPNILDALYPHYKILEVNGIRLADYETLYFDTPDLRLYHEHQSGRLNRYKIRQRNYVQSRLQFTEVKFKNNKGRTLKSRVSQQLPLGEMTEERVKGFLNHQTPYRTTELLPVLWVDYTRITLVSKTMPERLTLDLNLTFRQNSLFKQYPQVVIAEVKQETLRYSYFLEVMRQHNLREGSVSKYCLGMISLYGSIKKNRFKSKLNHFHKIIANHDFLTTT